MGIFSLFGKKDRRQAKPAEKDPSRAKQGSSRNSGSSGTRPPTVKRDAQTALATAMKIDAIESEMSSEFVNVLTKPPRPHAPEKTAEAPTPPVKPPASAAPAKAKPAAPVPEKKSTRPAPPSAPPRPATAATKPQQPSSQDDGTTTMLLEGHTAVGDLAAPASESAAVVEEAAIMYANGQNELVEQMLKAAIAEDALGEVTRTAWWMLFDLYQITGRQQEFETLSIDYASKFETSPPAWDSHGRSDTPVPGQAQGATPMVPFPSKLDAGCIKQVERLQKMAENYRALRLEFSRVAEVAPAGCKLVLGILKKLQKSGHELILIGAAELADKIHATIEVGRRDDSEDAWLLRLEILRLLNREKEFEEASIDYCVTFEVSPPAFVAPQATVTTAASPAAAAPAEGFMMPRVVDGRIDNLIVAIAAYSDEHNPALIDCAQLERVDFNAASRLLTGLAPFCGIGKSIEFHHVNHLVTELFNVIGLKDIARVIPRKS